MQEQHTIRQKDDEARREFRRRTLKGGKIIFNNRQSILDCTIRDLSKAGCRIIVPSQADIPAEFELHLPGSDERFKCRIIWRKQKEAGVKFE